ncbi:hypothetical protein DV515_00001405, partial [Chloebia gouldiae]
EEDFHEMIKSAHVMESQYGHLFDKVIVNDDLATAYNELKTTFDSLRKKPLHVRQCEAERRGWPATARRKKLGHCWTLNTNKSPSLHKNEQPLGEKQHGKLVGATRYHSLPLHYKKEPSPLLGLSLTRV